MRIPSLMLSDTAKLWLGRAGTLLSIAGIAFVALRFADYAGEIESDAIDGPGWLVIAILVLAHCGCNLLLTICWANLLAWLEVEPDWRWTLRTYATSQLAKYVPGNVMQFAGRQAMGLAAGYGNGPLFKSTIFELALLCGLAVLFAPLAGMASPLALAPAVALPAFGGLVVAALILLWRLGGRRLLLAGLCCLGFLVVTSLSFAACAVLAGLVLPPERLPVVAGAYVLAWLIGLVTPGAPAGLGVRDGLLLLMLGGMGDPPVIVLAVVLGRVVTVSGDTLFFVAGNAAGRLRGWPLRRPR